LSRAKPYGSVCNSKSSDFDFLLGEHVGGEKREKQTFYTLYFKCGGSQAILEWSNEEVRPHSTCINIYNSPIVAKDARQVRLHVKLRFYFIQVWFPFFKKFLLVLLIGFLVICFFFNDI
jgi:hypothetical protein